MSERNFVSRGEMPMRNSPPRLGFLLCEPGALQLSIGALALQAAPGFRSIHGHARDRAPAAHHFALATAYQKMVYAVSELSDTEKQALLADAKD